MHYKVLVLDLDGTVYTDGKPIKDVITKLNDYKRRGNAVFYLSNNTSVSVSHYLTKLEKLGLQVSISEIVTPTIIAAAYLKEKYERGYMLGTKSFIAEMESAYGLQQDDELPEFVLAAFDRELTYDKLETACKFINQRIPYYITHIDLACPSENGPIPDCGAISMLLESVTKTKPEADFGKPSDRMNDYISKLIVSFNKDEVLMVGDRLYTDMALGNKLGVKTLLVLSGESKYQDVENNTSVLLSHCSETLSDFLDGRELPLIHPTLT
ncbi:HAD-IIA family hydrolase [Pedobacter sp. SAFR-022]|uniref:HAD-IIA family hydrolase n=1 Tax=Pedobacter sp. SAFR-022 TaxID=3436861 RepID=UPI003F7E4CD3